MKKTHRIISFVLCLTVLLSLAVPSLAAGATIGQASEFPFTDVSENEWYYSYVYEAWESGFVDGMTPNEFRPDDTMTIAQAIKLAAVLHQAINSDAVTLQNGTPWYATYRNYAVNAGIIERTYLDYSDAQMNAAAMRREIAHIFHGAMKSYPNSVDVAADSIPDVKKGELYADEIYELYRAGILNGTDTQGTFYPLRSIKRCEIAAIFCRMMGIAFDENIEAPVGTGVTSLPSDDVQPTPDVSDTPDDTEESVDPILTAKEFDFADTALLEIEQAYEKCVVVYNESGRQYEKRAAENFSAFLKSATNNTFVQMVDQNSFSGEAEKQLTVYIGAVELDNATSVWEQFDSEGYAIYAEEGTVVVRGSSAENTYYAVSRLMNTHLHNDPDVLTNMEDSSSYAEWYKATREEYIEDISKLPMVWAYEYETPEWLLDYSEKLSTLADPNGRPMTSATKGDFESYPPNSIEAVISAVNKGADMIRVFCSTSKDGVLILNSGQNLDATTDWSEKKGTTVNGIALPESQYTYDWTYEQLCQLNLRTENGAKDPSSTSEISEYKIATVEEAIRVVNGRCFLSLEKLDAYINTPAGNRRPNEEQGINNPYWPAVYELLKKYDAVQCLTYYGVGLNKEQIDPVRAKIKEDLGIDVITQYDRTRWHNSVNDYSKELSLTTDEEYDTFYANWVNSYAHSYWRTWRLSKAAGFIGELYDPSPVSPTLTVEEFNLAENALKRIEQEYETCVVVYNENGRLYEKRAAENFAAFLKKNLTVSDDTFVQIVDQSSFSGETENQLTVYIGAVELDSATSVWQEFDSEGYTIYCTQGKVVVRGSSAENTYYAASRLMNAHLYNNPDILTNIEEGKAYAESYKATREEYIEDISKLPMAWAYEYETPEWLLDYSEKLSVLAVSNGRPMTSATKGDFEAYPANSIEAVISAINKGADIIRVDCSISKDGVLILNNGQNLDTTTDWSEKKGTTVNGIALPESQYTYDWTYEQLCQLNLRTGNGTADTNASSEVSDYQIATVEEAIRVANGRCFLSLERLDADLNVPNGSRRPAESQGINNPYWPAVYELVKKHNALQCLTYYSIGLNKVQIDPVRAQIKEDLGIDVITQFDRTTYHNSVYNQAEELSLTTEEEFTAFYDKWAADRWHAHAYWRTWRLSKAVDYINKNYGPTDPVLTAKEFNLSNTALSKIEQEYNSCVIVYNESGRLYEKRAAENFAAFLKKNLTTADDAFVQLVDRNSFSGEAEKQLTVHIGTVDTKTSANVWAQFDKDGYAIYLTQDEIVVRGSNAENTYYAVSRLMEEHLHGNPDIITNVETGTAYAEYHEVTRADYIEDIEKMPLVWEYEWSAPEWIFDFEQKLADLIAEDGRPMAYAHRGDIESYPENSIEAVISAVRKGADMIELDCEITKDGILVLNHGEDMTATTDWAEKNGRIVNNIQLPTSRFIYDWTYEQLSQLNLRAGNGQYSTSTSEVSGYKIATLEEAIQVANGKCFLSLDRLQYDLTTGTALPEDKLGINSPYWPAIFEMLKKHNAPQCILYMNMALTPEQASAMREQVDTYFDVISPSQFDRAGWHNSIVDWYAEFSLTTDEEFDAFYRAQLEKDNMLGEGWYEKASYLMVNRLSKCIDFINREYAPVQQ